MDVHKWAVFVEQTDGRWSRVDYTESTSFGDAAREAAQKFKKQKEIHPDKHVIVVKIFNEAAPAS